MAVAMFMMGCEMDAAAVKQMINTPPEFLIFLNLSHEMDAAPVWPLTHDTARPNMCWTLTRAKNWPLELKPLMFGLHSGCCLPSAPLGTSSWDDLPVCNTLQQ